MNPVPARYHQAGSPKLRYDENFFLYILAFSSVSVWKQCCQEGARQGGIGDGCRVDGRLLGCKSSHVLVVHTYVQWICG